MAKFNDLFADLGVFKSASNVANKATKIYKEEIFAECTESEKKAMRKKIRTMNENALFAIVRCNDKKELKTLVESYKVFAERFFIAFPTVATFSNINDESKKKVFANALEIIAKTK